MPKKKAKVTAYMAYFDTLGFEWIFSITDYEKKKFWAELKGNTRVDFPIPRYAILRAQANPQRFPEIWAFESELGLQELEAYAQESPQALADAIRQCGQAVYRSPRHDVVIN